MHKLLFGKAWLFAICAFLISLVAWSFASPVGASPDEDFHLVSIWCAGNADAGLCLPTGDSTTRMVSKALVDAPCFAHQNSKNATCQNFLSDTETFVTTDRGNFSSNYPPIYYWVMSHLAGNDIQTSVLKMRIFNGLLIASLLAATLALMPRKRRVPIVIAVAVTSVPLGQFLMGSISPSAWAIAFVPLSWLALYSSLNTDSRKHRYALLSLYGVSALLASGARGDAAAYVVFATGLAIFMTFQWHREYFKNNWLLFCAIGVGLTAGLILFFTSAQAEVITHGLPGLDDPIASDARNTISGAVLLLAYNISELPSLWAGSFGTWGLGWLDTPMPVGTWFLSLFAAGAVLTVALGFLRRREIIAIAVALFALVAIPLVILQASAARVGQQVQPRYLLPLIVLMMFILLSSNVAWDYRSMLPTAIGLTGLIIANSMALFVNLVRYINGYATGIAIRPDSWWWGDWSPWIVLGVGTVSFGLMIVFIFIGLVDSQRARIESVSEKSIELT